MRLHLVQYAIQSLDAERNHARVLELARAARVAAGGVFVLPELFSTGTLPQDFDRGTAAALASADRAFLTDLARETRSWVIAGMLDSEVAADGRLRNLCVVFGPAGNEVSSYRKIHPFSLGGEDKIFEGGEEVRIASVAGFTVQTAVCYDLRFPELFRAGSRPGGGAAPDLIVVPANWSASRREHWDVLLRARAIENQCYVAGVNCVGAQHGTSYAGGSALVSPKGEVLAAASDDGRAEGVVTAEVSADHVRAWRRVFPALRDRKPDGFWIVNPPRG